MEKQTVSRSTKRVLVTDATIRPGLVAIQSLAKAGFDVIAADSRRLPFALHSRYTPPYFRLPSQHEPTFLAALLALLENEKVDILVPLFCVEAVARHRAAIEERAAILVPPWEAFHGCCEDLLSWHREAIEKRAYELHEQGVHRDAEADWNQAQAEVIRSALCP